MVGGWQHNFCGSYLTQEWSTVQGTIRTVYISELIGMSLRYLISEKVNCFLICLSLFGVVNIYQGASTLNVQTLTP